MLRKYILFTVSNSTTPIVLWLSFIQIYYLGLTFLNCDDQMGTGAFDILFTVIWRLQHPLF